jgi:putative SOS response-associated peptidase YedK
MPKEAMTELFKATPANDLPQTPNYNVCPTDNIHTVTSDKGTRHLRAMRWGFVPSWYATWSDSALALGSRSKGLHKTVQ